MNKLTRTEWQEGFTKAWDAKTVLFQPVMKMDWFYENANGVEEPEEVRRLVDDGYTGAVDYSVGNQWSKEAVNGAPGYAFGDIYRKEVSIDDILGTYQTQYFHMHDGVIVEPLKDSYETGGFNRDGDMEWYKLACGLDVYALFDDPQDAVDHFYHETGCQY